MNSELSKTLWRTLLPIAIGIGVCVWLFRNDFSFDVLQKITFDTNTVIAILLALIFVVGRDFGLAWRFHTIAAGDLSWKRAFRVDIMCAFTSAITPSVVGGSALAIFYLNREGIGLGRATTLTLTTLFLDELFFVIFCPIIVLLLPIDQLFGTSMDGTDILFNNSIKVVFLLIYAGIVIWTTILYLAIIAKPEKMQSIFRRISAMRIVRRWKDRIDSMVGNMVATSAWVKNRPLKWWLNVFGATTLSWFSRYFVVNAIFYGFVPTVSGMLVFGRQFIVWVVLMISPTPGGSGISEWLFSNYYGDLIGSAGLAVVMAMIWRILSYYIYLFGGVCLLPGYFHKKHKPSSI